MKNKIVREHEHRRNFYFLLPGKAMGCYRTIYVNVWFGFSSQTPSQLLVKGNFKMECALSPQSFGPACYDYW